jgi:crossover junction endodeoxyribonuclease RuvC
MKGAIMAIDPGAISGATAILFPDGEVYVGDLAVVNGQLDGAALSRIVRDMRVGLAVVERVGAMPKQGVASTWKFGFACGVIQGVLVANGVPVVYVAPQTWKKHYNLIGKEKEASRQLAILRHPALAGLDLKRHQNRAEALLMLDWHLETQWRDK